jgi:hypothetical protein
MHYTQGFCSELPAREQAMGAPEDFI